MTDTWNGRRAMIEALRGERAERGEAPPPPPLRAERGEAPPPPPRQWSTLAATLIRRLTHSPELWNTASQSFEYTKFWVSIVALMLLAMIAWRIDAHATARGLAMMPLPERVIQAVYERDIFDISWTVVFIQIGITCIQAAWIGQWFATPAARTVGLLVTLWNVITSGMGVSAWMNGWVGGGMWDVVIRWVGSGVLGAIISVSPELLLSAVLAEIAHLYRYQSYYRT